MLPPFREECIKIHLNNNLILYGCLSKSSNKPRGLIIFIHGLLGNMDDHLFFNSSHFFAKKDFDTLRYNQYGFQNDTRKLNEDFQVFSRDLEEIIATFRNKYKKIFLVSHSLGSYTSLLTRVECSGIILWNPSLHPNVISENILKKGRGSIDVGYNVTLPKKLLDSFKVVPQPNMLFKDLTSKVAMVAPSFNSGIGIEFKKYINKIVSIKNASHSFDTKKSEETLFTITYSLINSLEDYKLP